MNDDKKLSKYIDHTLLKPFATLSDIKELCDEAKKYDFCSVCINPYYVKTAKEFLKDSDIKVCTVIGFPLGATTKEAKAFEAIKAVADGTDEVDMVINIGALKSKNYQYVKDDISLVVNSIPERICVKVILETCFLNRIEIETASKLAMEAGANFVKTSTGFGTGGANIEDVKLMKKTVGEKLEVKASGGVKSYKDAIAMIEAGATRIGTSSGVAIVEGKESNNDY